MERESLPLSSSSCSGGEEEEDRQTLIDQNQIEGKSPKRSSSSIFHIDNLTGNPLNATKNKSCYIFAIFLSFFIIILLFLTTDLNSLLFSSQPDHSSPHNDNNLHSSPILNRMRDSELQALNLLRTQQLGLLTLYSINQSASFKSHLLTQISLNNHIQQLLLSTHQPIANTNSGLHDNATDPSFLNMNVCGKLDQKLTQRKTVQWRPKGDNYLFAICVSGQMSNHLICLQNHMFFAALLNRVLVIPSAKVDYQFNRVLDIDHINKCFGRNVVVTFEEFAEAKKSHLHIDKFFCYFSKPQPCFLDDDHLKKLKSLGMTMNKLEPAWAEDVKNPSKKTIQDVVSKFSSNDDVIAIGDVFFADVERDMVMQPGGPIAHKCKTLIEPSRLIMLTAQRFVQTFLGERFIALHFRRHGFLKFCNAKSPSCFFPIPQAADCISRLVEKANTPVIYLSTDAAESETNLLQSLIVLNGKTVPLVKRPARNSAEKWDALLYRHGIEGDAQVEAMLDKTISAMSSVFIGASGSTFTEDILRLRKDWGSASLCDEYLCQGEVPNFIADNE